MRRVSKSFWIIALACLTLFAVYADSFTNDFAVHNDYRSRDYQTFKFDISSFSGMLQHDESMHLLYIGRPLNAILFNLQQSYLVTIQDFAIARLISFLTLLGIAIVLYFHLKTKIKASFLYVGISIFGLMLLPSSALYINWISNYVPGPLNLALALLAWLMFDQGLNSLSPWRKAAFSSITFILLLSSCLIYPATTLFFLFVPMVKLLFDRRNWLIVRFESSAALVMMAVSLVAYYVLHKLVLLPFFKAYFGSKFESYDPTTYQFSVSLNADMLKLFWEVINTGLHLISIAVENYLILLVNALVIISAIIASFAFPSVSTDIGNQKKNSILKQKLVLVSAFIGMTLAPILLTSHGFVAYRILFVFYSLCLVCWCFSLSIILNVARLYRPLRKSLVIGPLLLVAVCIALFNNRAIVENSKMEFDYFRTRLRDLSALAANNQGPVNVYVVLPKRYQSFVAQQLPYDLVYTATNYSGLMWSIVHLIAEEQDVSRKQYKIITLNQTYQDDFVISNKISNCKNCIIIETGKAVDAQTY